MATLYTKTSFFAGLCFGVSRTFSAEEPVLAETTSPSFRTFRSFLCDSEKNGLFTAFTLMMKTLLCHETIISFLFGFA
jgi:hypothetical protein